ncbi:MAG: MetQ/NlpA family ABC transporter substrate-binding protein [Levilactobacillus sp.]|jgi:D-methionine transport system substrate-binding protein|uniref:Lipoprotein n=1 Tax=Levilactobacillus suantsaiihabitans TaxID=2487722 RepID=A0A4Z0JBW6_9LACO|nr:MULTISPECIES: MetQ/NlpA family ABC transporter substrate-binding protein [Levilactobacillus]MCI1553239.1 MetQ/NlpA family ABC transporter substrate-binding protein [Levilactobacillus sp.]MCI1599404.1 MetQ/NlpA family ABC transporter substrate-binding protein [Levilactobacillus sp.]TGD20325.1 MetQ/NlpA family ABC transporter substrate-binding protein [Levilactobacillus suantsaiihabitans]
MKKSFKHFSWLLLLLIPLLIVSGCGKSSSSKTVKVGIMGSDEKIWKPIQKRLKKQGINIKLVTFTDYNQPNAALTNHEVDINSFQHTYFMQQWNKAHKTHIVSIGKTMRAPLRLYSKKVKSVSDIKKGDQITIPNDSTNEGRALHLLQSAGLIKVNNKLALPTPKNITENKLHLKITPVDAAQTPRSLSDAAGAVINNEFAAEAKLPNSETIYKEKLNKASIPYINIIATNKADKNNKTYKKIVKAYQSNETKKLIKKYYNGLSVPAW